MFVHAEVKKILRKDAAVVETAAAPNNFLTGLKLVSKVFHMVENRRFSEHIETTEVVSSGS